MAGFAAFQDIVWRPMRSRFYSMESGARTWPAPHAVQNNQKLQRARLVSEPAQISVFERIEQVALFNVEDDLLEAAASLCLEAFILNLMCAL
jgi:hypothetical protein